jgi:hypothetical protein
MRLLIAVIAVLVLGGCAAQNEISRQQREAEANAPDLSFQGPLHPVSLAPAQVKLVQKGIAASLKDPKSAIFGDSYRAGTNKDREIAVCGFVNGKRFVGMFAKPEGGSTEFLPIKVAEIDEEQPAVRDYCRADGVYLPQ